MRRLILSAALAVVLGLASCSNDRELGNTQTTGGNSEINFRSLIDKGAVSRATVTDDANILGFTVTGWWDKTSGGNGNITNPMDGGYLFNAFDISRREKAMDKWDYDPKLYWPTNGSGVAFFAYSPASSKNLSQGKGLFGYKGDPIEYTVPDPADNESQEDFLLARTEMLKSGSVSLNFAHALSRATFSAKKSTSGMTYIVKSVELVNIKKTGVIDLEDIPTNGSLTSLYGQTDPVVFWETGSSTQPASTNIKVDLGNSPVYVRDDAYTSLMGPTNALMVLPQTTSYAVDPNETSADFMVKVLYKAFIDAEDESSYYAGTMGDYDDDDTYKPVYFAVKDAARSTAQGSDVPHTFEIGRQYNFTLTFGAEVGDPIRFDVKVGEWDDAPQQNLPQPNYWFDGLISEVLANQANPTKYATEGVTLEQIEALGSLSISVNKNSDFKGLELFKNVTKLIIATKVDGLDVVVPSAMALTTMEINATHAQSPVLNKLDLASQSATLDIVKYRTLDESGYYGTLTINEFYLWPTFYYSQDNFDWLFCTYPHYMNDSSYKVVKLDIGGSVYGPITGTGKPSGRQ